MPPRSSTVLVWRLTRKLAAFVRGLSDDQRKMIDIGSELIAAPSILFLDEPTSGLDASIAFDVLKSIYDIARASDGKLSILLSIHQPNSRLLELVDNIMVLGNGTMTFFGTVAQSVQHLMSIGFLPPDDYSPMDFFLQVSDKNFSSRTAVNFAGAIYWLSRLFVMLHCATPYKDKHNETISNAISRYRKLDWIMVVLKTIILLTGTYFE